MEDEKDKIIEYIEDGLIYKNFSEQVVNLFGWMTMFGLTFWQIHISSDTKGFFWGTFAYGVSMLMEFLLEIQRKKYILWTVVFLILTCCTFGMTLLSFMFLSDSGNTDRYYSMYGNVFGFCCFIATFLVIVNAVAGIIIKKYNQQSLKKVINIMEEETKKEIENLKKTSDEYQAMKGGNE